MRKRGNAKTIKKLKKRQRKSRPHAVYISIRTIFDNLPKLTKDEVFTILSKPNEQLELSSDYYKAVFHSFKYTGIDTEDKLLKLLESEYKAEPVSLAKRKAI